MWSPIINSSHHSLLLGLTKPIDLVKHAKQAGYTAVGLEDNCMGGCVEFLKEAKKQEIKPILGQRFNVGGGHLVLIAQNTDGYYELVKLSFKANYADLTLEDIQGAKNLICLTGSLNSNFGATLFGDKSKIYGVSSVDEAKDLVVQDWVDKLSKNLSDLKDIFGPKLFLQSQFIDANTVYAAQVCGETARYLSGQLDIPLVATADSFYLNQNSAPDQRILLSSYAKSTLKSLRGELVKQESYSLLPFLSSNKYYVPTAQEMEELHRGHEQEILNCDMLTEMVGPIDVLSPPVIPKFDCPEGKSSSEYLTELCREGWKRKVAGHVAKDKIGTYTQRIKHELEVLQGAALDDYFLIVQDYVAAAKKRGELIGPGRGCLYPLTQIRTSEGLKPIKNIKIGDKVYTSDGELNNVINVFEYDCTEELIKIDTYFSDYLDSGFTSDHEILCEKLVRPKGWDNWSEISKKSRGSIEPKFTPSWIKASDIAVGDWLVIDVPQRKVLPQAKIDLYEFCDKNDPWIRVDEEFVYYEPRTSRNARTFLFSSKCQRFIEIEDELLQIIGNFCGNGYYTDSCIGICFNKNDVEYFNKYVNYFKKLGCELNTSFKQEKSIYYGVVKHRAIYYLFKKLFNKYTNSSLTKHVPDLIFHLDDKGIISFLKGYTYTDGNYRQKAMRISTSSELLSKQARELLLYLGIPASRKVNIREKDSRSYQINPNWEISFPASVLLGGLKDATKKSGYRKQGNRIYLKIRNVCSINNPDKKVYDIEVENKHDYCTANFIVHNSGAGCFAAYLLDITNVDPVRFDLIFERFYNAGRNSIDRISLPDLDVDFAKHKRYLTTEYIKEKYNPDNVAQIVTFGRIMGRSALKEVFRAHEACTFDIQNKITDEVPDEAKIADDLEEQRKLEGVSSIVKWALQENAEKLREYCYIDEEGKLQGPFAKHFEQAIRLEGTKKSAGKHASALYISPWVLKDRVPMVKDKSSDEPIIGVDMKSAEDIGLPKFDILAINALDKIMKVMEL